MAIAPDLRVDSRFVRNPGTLVLGDCVVVSASVALKGCWVRRTQSFAALGAAQAVFARAEAWWAIGGYVLLRAGRAAGAGTGGSLAGRKIEILGLRKAAGELSLAGDRVALS